MCSGPRLFSPSTAMAASTIRGSGTSGSTCAARRAHKVSGRCTKSVWPSRGAGSSLGNGGRAHPRDETRVAGADALLERLGEGLTLRLGGVTQKLGRAGHGSAHYLQLFIILLVRLPRGGSGGEKIRHLPHLLESEMSDLRGGGRAEMRGEASWRVDTVGPLLCYHMYQCATQLGMGAGRAAHQARSCLVV